MRTRLIVSLIAALALQACGERSKEPAAAPQPAAAPAPESELAAALRAARGKYYFDFVKEAGMERYAAENLGLDAQAAARFSRNMDIQGVGAIAAANGVEALVFTGCVEASCGGGAGPLSVIAIDVQSGDAFVGVKDAEGETVLKPLPRIQMLLTETSPTNSWSNPTRD
ncbi:MAG: hypothetical protein HXY28_04395 [Hydrogenophilaceae bacterium]|jgi:hypothetical protein|nr:hypothetical protein [Hydrogenophilaceae bacterium]